MNKKEKEMLSFQIVRENELLQKSRKINRNFLMWSIVFILIFIFVSRKNNSIDSMIENFIWLKWLFLLLAIICLIFCVLGVISYTNGKKRLLLLIDILEDKRKMPAEWHK